MTRLICQLQTCLLDSRLAGFAPATLALATLSLDLELFVGWQLWLPATVTLQTLAQVCALPCCVVVKVGTQTTLAPYGLRGCKNRPAPFPGQMS